MSKALRNLTFIGVGTMLGIFGAQFLPSYAKGERTPAKIVIDDSPVKRDQGFTTSFAPVIKKAAPSVVNIFASRTLKGRELRGAHPFFFDPRDPRFRDFFGEDGEDSEMPMPNQKAQALGS